MTALVVFVGGQAQVWWMRVRSGIGITFTLPPMHLSTFAFGILLARWQTLRRMQTDRPQAQAWQVNTVLWLSTGGILLSVWLVPFWPVSAPYFNGLLAPIFAGFIWALSVTPTRLSRWLCGRWLVGPRELQLRAIPHPLPGSRLVQAFSMGDPYVLSVVYRTLLGNKPAELSLLRNAGPIGC